MKKITSSSLLRIGCALLAMAVLLMAVPRPVQADGGIRIDIVSIKQSKTVTVKARNFPANQDFKVRIGPYYTFSTQYVVVGTINSGDGGDFEFTVNIPSKVKAGDLAAIRLDSPQGRYAYNAFYNNNYNVPTSKTATPTKTPKVTGTAVYGQCKLISVAPANNTSFSPRADFDFVWEVKNNSSKTWDKSSIDYKYVSGDKIYKHNSSYDLPVSVKSGEKIKIVVDVKLPSKAGTYTMKWALVSSSATICSLPAITVRVK